MLPAAAANAADATGKLTDTEKTELLSMLDSTAKDFLALIDGVTEEQWKWKSSPDRWSVGECAEHVILSERMLYQTALDALKSPADPEWATKTDGKVDFLKKVMPNRNPGGAGGAKAPQEIVPTGASPTTTWCAASTRAAPRSERSSPRSTSRRRSTSWCTRSRCSARSTPMTG